MDLQTKLENLPTNPGVYLMKNDQGEIIYVGKAINLRNRVRSYFRELKPDQAKTKALVKHIADLEYILADNELEALVLECNLIKKYRPKYNINLKDDKTYPYLKITNEDYPQVLVTRKVLKDGARYFGPYPSVNELRNSLEMVRKIFPFRSCRQKVFTNERPCLNAHIHMCYAPCAGRISKEDYNAMIDQIALFFEGKQDGLARRLRTEGKDVSVILGFNTASEIFYAEAFQALGCAVTVATADGSYGVKGFATTPLTGMDYTYFYTCGPESMLKAVYQVTNTSGQMSFEARMGCGFGACMGCSCKTLTGCKRICKDGPVMKKEEILWEA